MIGVDLVAIKRIDSLLKKYQMQFLKRFLNDGEIALVYINGDYNIDRIAGFYAAKEAFSKALQTGIGSKLHFHHIKISKNQNNVPKIKLTKKLKKTFNIKKISLSISHDRDYAIAMVLVKHKK